MSAVCSVTMSIDFRKNANVLSAAQAAAKTKQRTASDPYVVDGYELHARPDLVDRLESLMAHLPEARLEFAFGIPMLCTPTGRVFATVGGTHSLSLFLPDEETWGQPYRDTGDPGGTDSLGQEAGLILQRMKIRWFPCCASRL